ncbi:MAG: serine hydrolase domain-containing protein [Planctomycetota bacterium]
MLSLCLFLCALPTPQDSEDELVAELESAAWELVERTRVPGVGLAVVRGGKLVRAFGAGFTEQGGDVEVTGDTVFSVGSISKTVAAWGLMELVEEHKLALDAPVVTKRWQLPASSFDARGVTLRRLLSHTAGLSLHGYPGFQPGVKLPSLEASLSGDTNEAGDVRLEVEPGSRWQYSGGGYTWAQLLCEEASGLSFAAYMGEHVLLPLGMQSSAYGWSEELVARAARPHDERGALLPAGGPCFPELAAAGFLTTANDLARFALASMPRYRKETVLTNATLELMQTPAENSPEYGLGYGIRHEQGLTLVGHGGANIGWIAQLTIAPATGDAFLALTNASHGQVVTAELEKLWIAALAQRAPVQAR